MFFTVRKVEDNGRIFCVCENEREKNRFYSAQLIMMMMQQQQQNQNHSLNNKTRMMMMIISFYIHKRIPLRVKKREKKVFIILFY